MNKILKSIIKINILFCVGVMVVDGYNKTCEIHKALFNRKNKTTANDGKWY